MMRSALNEIQTYMELIMKQLIMILLVLGGVNLVNAETPVFSGKDGEYLDILHEGRPVVRYMYANDTSTKERAHETYKVYHHVFAPDRISFITKGAGGKFTHHRGIFLGWAKLGHGGKRYDHWHMKGVRMVHQKILEQVADDKHAKLTTLIHWNDPEGKPIIAEKRTFIVHYNDKGAYLMADFISELKAVNGDVELTGDPEHAGVQYRPHNDVVNNKSAKYTFHRDGIDPKKDKDLPYVAMTYKLGDKTYTVQHLRHHSNPKNSVYSAYRDYGRFGNYFVKTIKDGETLKLQYRFRITEGVPEPAELHLQNKRYNSTKG